MIIEQLYLLQLKNFAKDILRAGGFDVTASSSVYVDIEWMPPEDTLYCEHSIIYDIYTDLVYTT